MIELAAGLVVYVTVNMEFNPYRWQLFKTEAEVCEYVETNGNDRGDLVTFELKIADPYGNIIPSECCPTEDGGVEVVRGSCETK